MRPLYFKPRFLLVLIVLAALLVPGCGNSSAPEPAPDPLKEYEVTLLFEKDGVKVYRFREYGNNLYYTDARGTTNFPHRIGKVTVRECISTTQ